MSERTENLNLFKWDLTKQADLNSQFNIEQSMNENWDKLDEKAGNVEERLGAVEEYEEQIQTLQTQLQTLTEKQALTESQIPTGQAEGSEIYLSDSSNMELESIEVEGKTGQVQYDGYNMLPITPASKGTTGTSAGITYTYNQDGSISLSGTSTGNAFININNSSDSYITFINGTSYVSYLKGVNSRKIALITRLQSENTNVLSTDYQVETKVQTYTNTTGVACYSFIHIQGSVDCNGLILYPMIVKGTDTTKSYEPYCGGQASPNSDYKQDVHVVTGECEVEFCNSDNTESETYPLSLGNIELCKIGNYQDCIYRNGDDWYVHKEIEKIVLDETNVTRIAGETSVGTNYRYILKAPGVYSSISNAYCNWAKFVKAYTLDSVHFYCATGTPPDNQLILFVPLTWNELLSRIAEVNLVLYFPSATPTDTKITDTTLIAQLNALSEARTYKNITNITTTGSDLPPKLNVVYRKDLDTIINNLQQAVVNS